MYCDGCGAQVQTGHAFCGNCGKTLVGNTQRANRVEQHLHLLGVLWVVYSVVQGLGAVVLLIFVNTLFNPMTPIAIGAPPLFRQFLSLIQPFFAFFAMLLLLKAIADAAAGYGLLQRAPWARITALVVAFIAMLNVPFGTALGIYTVWVLLSPGADIQYQNLGRSVSV